MASKDIAPLGQIYITRFLAALVVVVYHFGYHAVPFEYKYWDIVLTYGNEAVNYFFCLSGYILVIAYYSYPIEKAFKVDRFLLNRFARIYPVYLLSLLLVAAYYLFVDRSIFTSFSIRFILELFLVQSWIGKTSLNFPGWSLSVEMVFYLLFPFLLSQLTRFSQKRLVFAGLLIYVLLQCCYIILLFTLSPDNRNRFALEYFPLMNLMTFVLGMIAGIAWKRYSEAMIQNRLLCKLAGYLACSTLIALLVYGSVFQEFHRVGLLAPVYCIFLLSFSIPSAVTAWLGNRFFIFLGDISYSLYILQYPVYLLCRYGLGIDGKSSSSQFYGYLLILLLISAVVYQIFELPVQQRIKRINLSTARN